MNIKRKITFAIEQRKKNDLLIIKNVPISEVSWNFYIGGYQPAQKWLKDRKERELSYEDFALPKDNCGFI